MILMYFLHGCRSDLKNLRIDIAFTLPRIEVSGFYEVSGQVLLFPVRSRGDFWAAFSKLFIVDSIYIPIHRKKNFYELLFYETFLRVFS